MEGFEILLYFLVFFFFILPLFFNIVGLLLDYVEKRRTKRELIEAMKRIRDGKNKIQ